MPIGGRKREDLTLDNIRKRVLDYDIFRFYWNQDFKIGKAYHSPFRKDPNPSFMIGDRGGFLHFSDFADAELHGNCIQFVQKFHGLDYIGALRKIDQDMGLGISSGVETFQGIIKNYSRPEKTKERSLIQVIHKKFSKNELDWWNLYYQDISDLKRENIFSIKKLYINRSLMSFNEELAFGYYYDEGWKIYFPLAKTPPKWMSSIPIDLCENIDALDGCEKGIITKSKKCRMVFQKLYPYVANVQNESVRAWGLSTIEIARTKSKEIYVQYDSDPPGVKASWELTKLTGFKHLNVPYQYLKHKPPIKDFSDWARYYSLRDIKDYLKEKNFDV